MSLPFCFDAHDYLHLLSEEHKGHEFPSPPKWLATNFDPDLMLGRRLATVTYSISRVWYRSSSTPDPCIFSGFLTLESMQQEWCITAESPYHCKFGWDKKTSFQYEVKVCMHSNVSQLIIRVFNRLQCGKFSDYLTLSLLRMWVQLWFLKRKNISIQEWYFSYFSMRKIYFSVRKSSIFTARSLEPCCIRKDGNCKWFQLSFPTTNEIKYLHISPGRYYICFQVCRCCMICDGKHWTSTYTALLQEFKACSS